MFVESWEIETSKFSARRLYELPPSGTPQLLYYPGPTTVGGHDGPIIETITVAGIRWSAMFAHSDVGAPVNGLYIWPPDDSMFCVISNGGGYAVNCNDPNNWALLKPLPIRGIFYFDDINTLVCYTHTDFYSWNSAGDGWNIDELALDDIGIKSVEGHVIRGWYNDVDFEDHAFTLDAETGNLMHV